MCWGLKTEVGMGGLVAFCMSVCRSLLTIESEGPKEGCSVDGLFKGVNPLPVPIHKENFWYDISDCRSSFLQDFVVPIQLSTAFIC